MPAKRREPSPKARTAVTPTRSSRQRGTSILMIASEAVPYAKTGGLADVTSGLSKALAQLGHEVTLIVPRYASASDAGQPVDRFAITLGDKPYEVGVLEDRLDGVKVVLLDQPELYDRAGLYGEAGEDYPDNARRFGLLARAALAYAARTNLRPTVLHAHDWQTGLVPVFLKSDYRDHPTLGRVPTVFTIHNLSYQGLFNPLWLRELGLGAELFTWQALEYWGQVSFLKGGINFAEIITTVSERYAREIQQDEFGFGFQGMLSARATDLVGILNGIDTGQWNPATDPHIAAHFTSDDLSGKAICKQALLTELSLPLEPARPVIGMVSRMIDQKGHDLMAALVDRLPLLNVTVVVLGTGEPRYERMWRHLASRHPDRFGVRIGFDEKLAHQIEAGSDIFLMPSRFEPCGLNQLYSMRYGTVPITTAVGGLDDTVEEYNPRTGRGTGFKVAEYQPEALLRTLEQAIGVYTDRQPHWRRLMLAGMSRDFSWERSAKRYMKVYEAAGKKVHQRQVNEVHSL